MEIFSGNLDNNSSTKAQKMFKRKLSSSFHLTFNQFLESTSFNGFKLLLFINNRMMKFLWSVTLLVIVSISVYIIVFSWEEFTTNPAVTTLESQEYPIWKVPFPAVAICSVNKISRTAVKDYAEKLFAKTDNITNYEELVEKLHLLGSLIDPQATGQDEAVDFQNFLDLHDTESDGYYNTRAVLEMLAPRCEDLLLRCHWLGKSINCSNIFYQEATSNGFCCIFNYARVNFQHDNNFRIRYSNMTGANQGLLVLMNSSNSDYFYNYKNTVGFTVKIFNALSFPDGTTGSLQELIINPLEELYMKLIAWTLFSENSLRPYSTKQRKCYFANEIFDFKNSYSYSNCLTKCKLRSIIALCNCMPYYAPRDLITENQNTAYCTMSHISCLYRYKTTWNTYKPLIENIKGLEREMEDSLNCPNCLPLCSTTMYNSEVTFSLLQSIGTKRMNWGILKGLNNLTEMNLLRVYFSTSKTLLFKKDVIFTWYEILGYFGGLLGICFGCSIISLLEAVYFATFRLYQNARETLIETKDRPKLLLNL